MPDSIHILLLEDRPSDAELALIEVRKEGIPFTASRVMTEEDFLNELKKPALHIILADYSLPSFDGMSALKFARAHRPEVPFLFVSGVLGEETAVDALHQGAIDYIVKHRIERLGPAVRRALHEAEDRRQLQRAQKELLNSEQLYHSLVESLPQLICRKDQDGRFTFANRHFLRALGKSLDEVVGHTDFDLFPADLAEKYQRDDRQICETRTMLDAVEEHQTADGRTTFVQVVKIPLLSASGELIGTQAIFWDVTERQRAADRIREQASLLDLTDDVIWVRDLSGRILYWNKGSERLLGWTAQEVLGHDFQDLFATHAPGFIRQCLEKTLSHGSWSGELKQQSKSGQSLILQSRWTLMKDASGAPTSILFVSTDITERKSIEAQFLRAQRLESLGQLAGGIAHDLNNILAPIMIGAALVREAIDDPDTESYVKMIESSAERGAKIIRQLLVFGRGIPGARVQLSLSKLTDELGKVIRETFPKSITYSAKSAPDLSMVEGDETQLHQVLLNLCLNARDAMPNGGALTLEAENVTINEEQCRLTPHAKPGPYVVLRVADNGTGIAAPVLESIFDPFFTTKSVDKGTGLGLSSVMGIVKAHSGFIQVESEPGKGSQFSVFLPSVEPAKRATPIAPLASPRGRNQMVLVIDDEVQVREAIRRTLENNGYRVVTGENGAQAVVVYAQYQKEIQLVLTDMMMPIMDGPAAILVLRRANPDLKIVAMSGVESSMYQEAQALGAHAFLPKPFNVHTLLATVGELLNGTSRPSIASEPSTDGSLQTARS